MAFVSGVALHDRTMAFMAQKHGLYTQHGYIVLALFFMRERGIGGPLAKSHGMSVSSSSVSAPNASCGEIGPSDDAPMSSCFVANMSWLSLAPSPSDARMLVSVASAGNDTLWLIASTNAKLAKLDNARVRESPKSLLKRKALSQMPVTSNAPRDNK